MQESAAQQPSPEEDAKFETQLAHTIATLADEVHRVGESLVTVGGGAVWGSAGLTR